MEALKLRFFVIVLMALVMGSTMASAAHAHAPAPSPTSDATIAIPTVLASFSALVFGFFFC
ncbi:arabinogalactan protein 13-like [Tasmannia lanceolata]|uniref:arabinogalactan protein 13-like n=1 Tax=Tasmannia lanceolata TaxID=3420 RepID=UPI00406427C6